MERSKTARIMREARGEMSIRKFAAELGVSHNAVALWETTNDVDDIRIKDWLRDEREWVRVLAARLWTAKHGAEAALVQEIELTTITAGA